MALQFDIETLEGLDPAIAAQYEEKDGRFFLNIDGAVSKTKLNEFRDTNVRLMKEKDELAAIKKAQEDSLASLQEKYDAEKSALATELEALKAKKEDLKTDPPAKDTSDELKALTKQIKQLEAIKKAQEESLNSVQSDLTSKLTSSEQEKASLAAKLRQLQLNAAIAEAVNVAGLDPKALPAIKLLAAAAFKVEGDALVPYEEDGTPMFSKDGTSALSVTEWASNLKKSMPQFALQSFGAGLQPGNTTTADTTTLTPLQAITAGLGARK